MGDSQYEAGANYILLRDGVELNRLNTQHIYLTKIAYGGKLLYGDDLSLGPNSRVLDSGTGSAIWLLELAKQVPDSVELDGIDVSSNNFPASPPPNMHFHIGSVTSLPAEWTGRYDFIHQRLLMAALVTPEWPVALSEMFRVLKPGGHVFLLEMDLPSYATGPVAAQVKDCMERLWEYFGLMFDCSVQMPRMLKEAGFTVVSAEKRYGPAGKPWGKWGEYGKISNCGALESMTSYMVKAGIMPNEAEYKRLLDNLVKEWAESDGVQYIYRVVLAQKPL